MINQAPHIYETVAEEEDKGLRLDKFLSIKLDNISRSRLKSLIVEGQVLMLGSNKIIDDPSYRVKPLDGFKIEIPEIIDPEPEGEDIPLDIHYEDEHLLVLYKPAGMVVHPAPGNNTGTLVNALIHHCGDSLSGINGVKRPGIVHRIDKDTSGLMVVAKSDIAHRGLSKQFAKHSMERAYMAVCWGVPNPTSGMLSRVWHPACHSWNAVWKQAGHIRYVCTWPTKAIHWSATRCIVGETIRKRILPIKQKQLLPILSAKHFTLI